MRATPNRDLSGSSWLCPCGRFTRREGHHPGRRQALECCERWQAVSATVTGLGSFVHGRKVTGKLGMKKASLMIEWE